ncbi:MAG: ornithine cyclodeaminase [Hoeflea sp. BRH_c9]|nr:MAG: ornithine cyclodeaminase [Hoeflea sp. BRH_c9]
MTVFISEEISGLLIDRQLAFEGVKAALIAAVDGSATSFPPVQGHGTEVRNRFSVKSAAALGLGITGIKIGSYWPDNARRHEPRHNSCVLFFDEECGRIVAVVEAGIVNGYRTAAANAVAAACLARPGSETLAVFGAGNQARFEVAAVRDVLPIRTVLIVNRDADSAVRFAAELSAEGLDARPSCAKDACLSANMIITATAARAPLFDAHWVRAGTHLACMGADAVGKQELPPELLAKASLYADLPSQSVRIGEFQHVARLVEEGHKKIVAIGDALRGQAAARQSDDEITVFDSSGIALQDIFVVERILARAIAEGSAVSLPGTA